MDERAQLASPYVDGPLASGERSRPHVPPPLIENWQPGIPDPPGTAELEMCVTPETKMEEWERLLGKKKPTEGEIRLYADRYNQRADAERRENTRAQLHHYNDGLQQTPEEREVYERGEYIDRMLTALTANPMGAIGYGLGRATGADEMRQLQLAEIYANLGNVMTLPVVGKQIEKQPAERQLEQFPPESPARSPHSPARQAQQVADTQQRAAKSATELDRPEVGGHGYADHGAHTTDAQQAKRVETGVTPSGRVSRTPRATRFDTNEAQLEAVGRARHRVSRDKRPEYNLKKGTPLPNEQVSVESGRKGGYGSGLELVRDPATGKPIRPRTAGPTGPTDPNARVLLRYNPKTGKWDPVTSFPTKAPVTR